MLAEQIPAVSIGIVHRGKTYFINQGQHDLKQGGKVDSATIFQIASLGKPLVGIVANELMLAGAIRADQPITVFLDQGLSAKRWVKLQKITFAHLLHHMAGLPQDVNKVYRRKDGDAYNYDFTRADFYTELEAVKLKNPGKYQYSNFGFALLTHLLEQATGKSYEELLQAYVLQPLIMDDTVLDLNPPQSKRLATPYRKDKRVVATQPWNMGKMAPPSGIYSTTADLTKLLKAQITAYQKYTDDKELSRWILSHDRVQKGKESRDTYGYGFQCWDQMIFGHGGDMDGYASHYVLYPERDYGIILLTSSGEDWINPLVSRIHGLITP